MLALKLASVFSRKQQPFNFQNRNIQVNNHLVTERNRSQKILTYNTIKEATLPTGHNTTPASQFSNHV